MMDERWCHRNFTSALLRLLAGMMNHETQEVAPVSQALLDRLLSVAPDRETFERDASANSAIRVMRELGQIDVIRNPPAPYGYRILVEIDDEVGCFIYAEQCRMALAAINEDLRKKAEELLQAAQVERELARRQAEWEDRRRGFLPAALEVVNAMLLDKHACQIRNFAFLRYPRKLGSFDLEYPQLGLTIVECAYYIDKYGTPRAGGPSVLNDGGSWITFANFSKELRDDIGAMIAVAISEAERLADANA